ncbi:hypothetical protein Moror_15020 [Moniliophthora roreri MCA 2997]|uniref:Uncharacterized protein n=1 Tax=Moniliophthora roreri (strain MCA 2997) TaxID=1381753 RepID=V2WRK1_MONRO|nr:hypothetical protein Moror_15020 [Moniliophthora roreri MCA 2997]
MSAIFRTSTVAQLLLATTCRLDFFELDGRWALSLVVTPNNVASLRARSLMIYLFTSPPLRKQRLACPTIKKINSIGQVVEAASCTVYIYGCSRERDSRDSKAMDPSKQPSDAHTDSVTTFAFTRYLTFSSVIVGPTIITGIQFLLYGLYIPLFCGLLYLLKHRRPQNRTTKFHRISLVTLFVLATIGLFVNTTRILLNCALKFHFVKINAQDGNLNPPVSMIMDGWMMAILSLSNITADVVLLFRCYCIWGYRGRIVMAPAIGCALSNLLGIASTAMYLRVGGINDEWYGISRFVVGGFLVFNAAMNVFLTLMVAGRIWYIARSWPSMNRESTKKLNLVAALILESGMLYPIALVLDCVSNTNGSMVGWNIHPLLVQVAGIAQTLIMVRACLGIAVEGGGNTSVTIAEASQVVSEPVFTTVGSVHNVEEGR